MHGIGRLGNEDTIQEGRVKLRDGVYNMAALNVMRKDTVQGNWIGITGLPRMEWNEMESS